MLERDFQADLISTIKDIFQGVIVLKNDANYLQGFPDLTILYKDKFAVLECKQSGKSTLRPNQQWYITLINNNGGFARVIYPENRSEILDELQQAFGIGG